MVNRAISNNSNYSRLKIKDLALAIFSPLKLRFSIYDDVSLKYCLTQGNKFYLFNYFELNAFHFYT